MENKLERSIVEYLKEHGQATSVDIAERFLKFNSPNEQMANIPVTAVLKGVEGVFKNDKGLWSFDNTFVINEKKGLLNKPWAIVSIINGNDRIPICVAVSNIESDENSKVFWLIDPEGLDEDLQTVLRSGMDNEFISAEASVAELYKELAEGMVICRSYKEQGLLARLLLQSFFTLPDETYLLSTFTRAVDIKMQEIEKLYEQFYGEHPINNSAMEISRTFGAVVKYLLEKLEEKGVKNLSELISFEVNKKLIVNWNYLKKSVNDILKLDKTPGVYGFMDQEGKYIYIGKAKNLQRRLLSYFRVTDESPAKLKQLRETAYDLTIYRCGSELESLLYEQRLINKYQPPFNRKVEVNERAGIYKYLKDSIIVLPHSNENKIVTFWIKEDEKVRLMPLSIDDFNEKLAEELDKFYYGKKLPAEKTDFQELEIVNRWAKQNEDGQILIEVKRYNNSLELMKQVRVEFESMRRE